MRARCCCCSMSVVTDVSDWLIEWQAVETGCFFNCQAIDSSVDFHPTVLSSTDAHSSYAPHISVTVQEGCLGFNTKERKRVSVLTPSRQQVNLRSYKARFPPLSLPRFLLGLSPANHHQLTFGRAGTWHSENPANSQHRNPAQTERQK